MSIFPGQIIARNFYKNRSYPILKLLGLSVGFAVFMLAAAYVYFDTHFESFNYQAERIYRATCRYSPPGDYQAHWARVPFYYINELPREVSGVEGGIDGKVRAFGKNQCRSSISSVLHSSIRGLISFRL